VSDKDDRVFGEYARIGLTDGTQLSGEVVGFSPDDDSVVFTAASSSEGPNEPRRIPATTVSFVAFRTSPQIDEGETVRAPAVRVKLVGDATFHLEPLTDSLDPRGFRGRVLDATDPEEVYVFAHGIRSCERDDPVGSLLIQSGAVSAADVARGLRRQADLRRRRIGSILVDQNHITSSALEVGLALQIRKRARLGEVLVEAGLVTSDQIDAALAEQRHHRGRRLGEILMDMGLVDERTLAMTLAHKFNLPFVDLDECLIDAEALRMVDRGYLEKHRILPIEVGPGRITIAVSDPLDTEPVDMLRFSRSDVIREVMAIPSQITSYLAGMTAAPAAPALPRPRALAPFLPQEELVLDPASETAQGDEEKDDALQIADEADGAIIQLANQIVVEAVQRGASDIHVEPNGPRDGVRIRLRIDGQCIRLPDVPATHRNALVSRLKIMAQLDISERRKPQDGKIRIRIEDRTVELRVATVPTVGGEDVVLRILSASKPIPMRNLGLHERNHGELARLIERPYGLVLCVGPTGSGKSTSLHSLLGHINDEKRTIWTAEDPVEITQAGLRQVQVRPKIGFTFADAMRAFLRADPDVIMVGEMRDRETAGMAVEASLTGHLVLSTLHTNNAPETIVRLVDMGIDPLTFGDALLGVLAQRLTRRLCEDCRSLEPANDEDRDALRLALGSAGAGLAVPELLWRSRGCNACGGTGYRGRLAIHELLVVDGAIRAAIQVRAGAEAIRDLAVAGGMTTLLQDGARKCLEGHTDLSQVRAVCST
jgi:type II secretory ATPase GspE/PulE/Tfp pilus assembly ATPase PilB-like protein